MIRHGAHGQLDRRLSGRAPHLSLSETGRAQAAALGRALADAGIDRVDASPLERTVETAAALPAPMRIVDDLIEIDMGRWTGQSFDALADDPDWDAWNAHRGTARIPGGESMAEAQARIAGYLDRVAAEDDGRTIAVVSHSDMIRAGVAHVLGLPLDNLLRFDVDPASVTRMVYGNWGGRVLSLNERLAA